MITKKHISCLMMFLLTVFAVSGQAGLDKEIVVIKPYQPTLSDAFKINILPGVSDSLEIRPEFNYVIRPEKYETGFEIKPIKAASLVGQPPEKLYKGYLKLGMGNHFMPLAELNISSLRSKEFIYGIGLKHNSINGKIKLSDDVRKKPGYNDNAVKLSGSRIFERSRLSGALKAGYLGINYYGFDPSLRLISFPDYEDIKQHYIRAGGEVCYESLNKRTNGFNYKATAGYSYLQDKFSNSQHVIDIHADFSKFIKGQLFGLDAGLTHIISSPSVDSSVLSVLRLDPWISKRADEYNYIIGARLAVEIDEEGPVMHIYPRAKLQVNVVNGVLMPYLELDGYLRENSFTDLSEENPFILPGLNVKSTSNKVIFLGGLTGSLTTKLSYDVNAFYTLADDLYFYVNDTAGIWGNQFNAVLDDGGKMQVHGELSYRYSEKLWLYLAQNYYRYELDSLAHPWHKQQYDLTFSVRYNLKDKILANLDIFYVGDRYARNYLDPAANPYLIDGTLDMNLGLEYRYTKALSVFLRLNHLMGSEQFLYYQYPTMRFNFLAGFTYSL